MVIKARDFVLTDFCNESQAFLLSVLLALYCEKLSLNALLKALPTYMNNRRERKTIFFANKVISLTCPLSTPAAMPPANSMMTNRAITNPYYIASKKKYGVNCTIIFLPVPV